jgi:DNA-binding response OmpR family regulator
MMMPLSAKMLEWERVKILSSAKSKTKTRRILLVDDEPDVAVTIEMVLEESGFFQVDLFNDGATALSIFGPRVYDLAILDIKMLRMNGFELCRKIRDIDNKIKVCFLTAADLGCYRETDSDIINDLGTDCFITKPVNNEDIVQRLKLLLSI